MIEEKIVKLVDTDNYLKGEKYNLNYVNLKKIIYLNKKNRIYKFNVESESTDKIYNVDTSAAAISACGMLTLYELGGSTDMLSFAVKTLEALSAEYVNRNVNVPGILKYQNGQKSYTTYGDYFYTELLLKVLYNIDICW